jgi:hypothetical protein
MGVFTFVCRNSGDEWTGKSLSGDLEASAGSTFELQRKLVHTALSADSSGGVQSSFSFVTPTSGVFQVSLSLPISLSAFLFRWFYLKNLVLILPLFLIQIVFISLLFFLVVSCLGIGGDWLIALVTNSVGVYLFW